MSHRRLKRTCVRTLPACHAPFQCAGSKQRPRFGRRTCAEVFVVSRSRGELIAQFNFSLNSTFTPLRQSSLMPIRYTGARSVIVDAINFVDA